MGIIVKYARVYEYVDRILVDNPGALHDVEAIHSWDWRKNQDGVIEQFRYAAVPELSKERNGWTVRLKYEEEHNRHLVERNEIELGVFTFSVENGQYQGTGEWDPDEGDPLDVEWIDNREHRYSRGLARPEQAGFRAEVTRAYKGKCAVTRCSVPEALEAAHLVPVADGGEYALNNGILLRRDVHRLFDLNLVAMNPDNMNVAVADRIVRGYGKLSGKRVKVPCGGPAPEDFAARWQQFQESRLE